MTPLLYIGLAIGTFVVGLAAGYVLGHKFEEDESLKRRSTKRGKGNK